MDFRMSFIERMRTQQSVERDERSLDSTNTESLRSFGNRLRNFRRKPLYLSERPISGRSGGRPPYLYSRPVKKTGSRDLHSATPQNQIVPYANEDKNSLPSKIAKYLFSPKIKVVYFYALLLYFVIIVLKSLRSRGGS